MHTYPEIPASAQFMLQLQNMEAESMTGVKAFNQGLSGEAAILISAIENSHVFANPEFRSAVTQVPRMNSEQFHLAAAWQSEDSR